MKHRFIALIAALAFATGCRSFNSAGSMAAAHPAALLAGVGLGALAVAAAPQAFQLDPAKAEEAEDRFPTVEARVMADPTVFPPP